MWHGRVKETQSTVVFKLHKSADGMTVSQPQIKFTSSWGVENSSDRNIRKQYIVCDLLYYLS